LPASEQFELLVPVTASLDLKRRELRKAQNAIVEWVAATASSLPIAPLGRYVTPIQYTTLPDVPFDVALARMADGVWPGKLRVAQLGEQLPGGLPRGGGMSEAGAIPCGRDPYITDVTRFSSVETPP
jgi:hypothetical protein